MIAVLFMIGSACFALGSVPAYLDRVGERADAWTFVVGAVFFTSASFAQLLQAQTPAMTAADDRSQHVRTPVRWWAWLPHDRGWLAAATQFPGTLCFNVSTIAALATYSTAQAEDHHVWRPDVYGSTLFLVSSAYAVAALGRSPLVHQLRTLPGGIAWLNMLGSILFGLSAIGAFVLPDGSAVDDAVAVGGTLLGAVCFLLGAALMFPAWSRAVRLPLTRGEPT
ncbi:hypothetical protein GON03_00115 [Nocardioides sp. MAH-18]|uniref:YrhK domain-containing protein n=1 Tax=Nocardioides agri TaxID=2682843 RepID=A0A6L6XKV7_9ACTN|nr:MULTISPECIES: hypothetical protein [unclassified Nocardioides]MBA2956423.1 hypothetical protein [Nocardioides sp. CGMCC 1.13656]MVQ47572.1 hypothetical protein [Nocardioides sp. MAH-18]